MKRSTLPAAFSTLLFILLFRLSSVVQAVDSLARDKCRELHHVEADGSSSYSNNNCLLRCVIHGSTLDHSMNEGFPCPLAEAGVCRGGQCVPKNPNAKLGSLQIELLSATFPASADLKAPHVNVCLMNSTNHQTLPLKDMSTCSAHCQASLSGNGLKWTHNNGTDRTDCSGLFVEHAGVYLEAKGSLAGQASVYLGGISLTVPQLLSHGDNNKPLHLQLTGAAGSADLSSVFINTRITWTKRS